MEPSETLERSSSPILTVVLTGIVLLAGMILLKLSVSSGRATINHAGRDLSTPCSRLIGRWRASENSPEVTFRLIDQDLRIGALFISGDAATRRRFRILSEESSGTEIILRLFEESKSGFSCSSDVRCSVARDGQSLSMEWPDSLLVLHYVRGLDGMETFEEIVDDVWTGRTAPK